MDAQKVEFDHGNRVTRFEWEQTPLENALDDLERKARDHYAKQSKMTAGEAKIVGLEGDLKGALAHLEKERKVLLLEATKTKNVVKIQLDLDEYREKMNGPKGEKRAARKQRQVEMGEAKWHPTDTLANNLRAAGRPKPGNRFSPHHIVPGKGRTTERTGKKKDLTKYAYEARIAMHVNNIGINDPDNGVWLPRAKADKGHWSMPKASAHLEIHTENYEKWVYTLTLNINEQMAFRMQLRKVSGLLIKGQQPRKVTQCPDEGWDGLS